MAEPHTTETYWNYSKIVAAGLDPHEYEVDNGKLVERRPRGPIVEDGPMDLRGGRALTRLARILDTFVDDHGLGAVYTGGCRFDLGGQERQPDLAFLRTDRLPRQPEAERLYPTAPDLAVEVVSPTDSNLVLRQRAEEFLSNGGVEVWIVEPQLQHVVAVRTGEPTRSFGHGHVLETLLLPGFSLAIDDLFPA